MKKYLSIILCICMLVMFSSCNEAYDDVQKETDKNYFNSESISQESTQDSKLDEEHTHSWKKEFVTNDTYHWYACESFECFEIYQKETHQWQEVLSDDQNSNVKKKRCSVCGIERLFNQSNQGENRYTVSEEEWGIALSMKTTPTVIAQHVYYPEADEADRFIYYSVTEVGQNVVYNYDLDETFSEKISHLYVVKEGGTYIRYFFNSYENVWEATEMSEDFYNHMRAERYEEMNIMFKYEDFTFDSDKESYICQNVQADFDGELVDLYNIELKFSNGKLISYYFEAQIDGYNAVYTTFSYEPIEIVLPEFQ